VELSELESALSEIEPVKHCAVTVRNDQRGARFLVAHVELDGGHYTPDDQRHALATIEAEARAKLPPQMVPRELRVVAEMPLTLSGKIDRKQLD